MKTLLITGGAGYLGYRILKKIKNKYRIIILDNFLYSEPDDLKKISKKIKYYIGNAEDKYLLTKIFSHKIDSVIHLSGLSNDPSSALNPELTRKANDESTINLLNISKRKKVERFIFASSCSVYGFTGSKKFVTEKAKLNPLSEYALSKVKCEKMIKKFSSKSLTTVSLRKGTLFGPSFRMRFDLVVNNMVAMALAEKKIILNGGDQWRPFLHIDDAADAYIKMLTVDKSKINGKIFNIGLIENNITIRQLAEIIKKKFKKIRIIQSGVDDKRSYKVDFAKFNKEIDWQPHRTIDEGITDLRRYIKKHKINYKDVNYYNIKRLMSHLNM